MKAWTDIEQSKKLAEILPLESADMCYLKREINDTFIETPIINPIGGVKRSLCCWSLAALLSVTRNYCTRFELTLRTNKKYNLFAMGDNFVYRGFDEYPDGIDNPIDTCYEMILKLYKQNLL